jgi:3-hydroxyisobutyrate dehydrogenase
MEMAGDGGEDGRNAEKLGYLGLGMMGFPMTRRLINAGYDVTVWNRSPGKAAALVEAGAKLAAHPRDVAATASIIFMCEGSRIWARKVPARPQSSAIR